MISFDKFTQKAQEAIGQAQMLAAEANQQQLHPAHLLLALASAENGIVRSVLSKLGIDAEETVSAAHGLLNEIPSVQGATTGLQMDRALQQVFTAAQKEAAGSRTSMSRQSTCCLPSVPGRTIRPGGSSGRQERRTRQFCGRSPRFVAHSALRTPTRKTSTRRSSATPWTSPTRPGRAILTP